MSGSGGKAGIEDTLPVGPLCADIVEKVGWHIHVEILYRDQ
jgi:hypothetical protein